MDKSISKGTDSYSEAQKLAYHYLDKQATDASWRPVCPECRKNRRGNKLMIKLTDGFQCIDCKATYSRTLHKV